MPGFDGTGPRGMGPMTGGGRGMCVLNLSAESNGMVAGLAGHAGRPVRQPLTRQAELAQLRHRARYLEVVLADIRGRIERLPADRPQEPNGAQERRKSL